MGKPVPRRERMTGAGRETSPSSVTPSWVSLLSLGEAFAKFRSGYFAGNGHKRHKKNGMMRNDQGMWALCDRMRRTAFDLL